MAEKQTTARPYAEAAFALATERGALGAWSEMLGFIRAVAGDANMARLASDPRTDRARFVELFLDVCGQRLTAEGANFVRLLAENRRLGLMPEIVAHFEHRRAEAERRIEADVVSAFALEPAQIENLERALKRRFGREVRVNARVDAALIGGIVIRAGDTVIDGSVKGRLAALASHMSH